MKFLFALTCIFLAFNVSAETVYKTVDENGNIIFTDRPSEDAEEIKVKELQTIENPNPGKFEPLPKKPDPDANVVYKNFLVANPANGSGLRSNAGNVTISLILEPNLRNGHNVIISLDGQEVSNGPNLSASVDNVFRGAHSISAQVVDSTGRTLISTSSNFSLLTFGLFPVVKTDTLRR